MSNNICAILCSDLHLSHKPPIARSAEPDWYAAMARQLHELNSLAETFLCPIIVAGDVFDRWNAPAELINFAFQHLPKCYAVPGQHDLSFHNYKDIRKTAYWSLYAGGLISNIPPRISVEISSHGLRLHGFPWGTKPQPLANPHDLFQEIAVVHHYVWKEGYGHPNASNDDRADNLCQRLGGYTATVCGDNHTSFRFGRLFNCGGFFRRRSDETDHRPSVGLLDTHGTMTRHYLDCSADIFADPGTIIADIETATGADLQGFVKELSNLGDALIDWPTALRRYMKKNKVRPEVRRAVLKALET